MDEKTWMRFNTLKLMISGCGCLFYEYNMPADRDEYKALLAYANELIDIIDSEVDFSDFEVKGERR